MAAYAARIEPHADDHGPALQRQLIDEARAALPDEMLWLLGGDADGRVGCARPLAGAGRPDGFVLAPERFLREVDQLQRDGWCWLGFAHSHPRGRAALSQRDRRELWHGCQQWVLGLPDGGPPELRAFWLDRHGARELALRYSAR